MQCPPPLWKCKLFRIKHITLLEGETFLRNKHDIAFFEIKCTFFGRKENTISHAELSNIVLQYQHAAVEYMQFNKSVLYGGEYCEFCISRRLVANAGVRGSIAGSDIQSKTKTSNKSFERKVKLPSKAS